MLSRSILVAERVLLDETRISRPRFNRSNRHRLFADDDDSPPDRDTGLGSRENR